MPVQLCLSSYACPVMPVQLCLSSYACPVLPVQFCLSSSACPLFPLKKGERKYEHEKLGAREQEGKNAKFKVRKRAQKRKREENKSARPALSDRHVAAVNQLTFW
jgi:hypothetical protein